MVLLAGVLVVQAMILFTHQMDVAPLADSTATTTRTVCAKTTSSFSDFLSEEYVAKETDQRVFVSRTRMDPPFYIVTMDPTKDIYISKELLTTGTWEMQYLTVLRERLHEPCSNGHMRYVDVGANLGTYGLYAAAMGCRVTFFEPQLRMVRRLRLSLELNFGTSWPDAHRVVYAAAGFEPGTALLRNFDSYRRKRPTNNFGGLGLVESEVNCTAMPSGCTEVPLVRVDDTLLDSSASNGVLQSTERIILLKIDVETFEPWVVRGLTRIIGRVDNVFLEYTPDRAPGGIQAAIDMLVSLQDAGFTLRYFSERSSILKDVGRDNIEKFSREIGQANLLLSRD